MESSSKKSEISEPPLWRLLVVVVSIVGIATGIRRLLDPVLEESVPFITFFPALVVAAWYGGARAAVFTTLLSVAAAWLLFIPPEYSLAVTRRADLAGVLVFATIGASISLFSGTLQAALRRSKAAERGAAEQAERLSTTLTSIGDAVMMTDTNGVLVDMNPVAESLTGWTRARARGRPLTEVFHIVDEETRQPADNPALRVFQEGTIVGFANRTLLITEGGSEVPIDDSAAPIRDRDGVITGCVLVFRDVTERRRLMQEASSRLLAASSLAAIVESSNDAILGKSLEGVIQSWNAAAERTFGYSAAQAIGRPISLIIPAERLAEEERIIGEVRAGRRVEHFDTVRVRADGQYVHVSLTLSPIRDESGRVTGVSTIARDVTERKRAEEERQRFSTLIESSTDLIGICDTAGRLLFVNRAGLELIGWPSLDEAGGHFVWEFLVPEDQRAVREKLLPLVRDEGHGELEVRMQNARSGATRWLAYKLLALRDRDGTVTGFGTLSQDITERRHMEQDLRRLAADLSEAGRRKDEFLATLAHELRNPLAPILNGVHVLGMSNDPSNIAMARTMMERQIEQMVRLIDDLLDVSRITRGKLELRKEHVALGAVIDNAVETSRPLMDDLRQQLTVALPKDPVTLRADAARLAQVYANLLNNSAKYTAPGGQIWLTATIEKRELVVSVKDTGIGIRAEHLPRIFEMFSQVDSSLERSQGGLGIGLTLVKRLVEMHGGSVEARSEGLGTGAEFTVRLPVVVTPAEEDSAALPAPSEDAPVARRILIVDDNRDHADSLAMLLQIGGSETRTAYDGERAVVLTEEFQPDAVLLDIGLPGLNGYETARRIRASPQGKHAVLIAITGWGQEEDRRRSADAGFDHHLTKPIATKELVRLLANTPDAR